MKVDNMKSVVTFTIFSFLLFIIAMFLVFFRYDLYTLDSATTSIHIGLIVENARNGTKMVGVPDANSREPKPQTAKFSERTIPYNFENQVRSGHPSADKTPYFRKIIAIVASESHQPAEAGGQKFPSGVDVTHKPPSDDPIRRLVTKLGESKGAAPVGNVDSPVKNVETILLRPKFVDRVERTTAEMPSTPKNPKRSGASTTTRSPEFEESEHNRQVSYPAESLPSPVPAASPPKSWPSSFLPDSGFADSSEISPFSLFSRFANFGKSDEDESSQPEHDSQEMWPRFDDITDFFISPRKGLSQGNRSEESKEESNEDYDETHDSEGYEFQNPIY